jgi:hypothetical protein
MSTLPLIAAQPDNLDALAVQNVSSTPVATDSLERVELRSGNLDDLLSRDDFAGLGGVPE